MNKMPIRVLLVDDEPTLLKDLEARFQAFPAFRVVGKAEGMEEAVKFLASVSVDLAFLDIQMKGESGFVLAAYIREQFPSVQVVFLTGHAGFALEGYDYEPVDFLVKPVSSERFAQTLERVERKLAGILEERRNARVGFHTERGFCLFQVNDILYLEKVNRKVCIVCRNGEVFQSGDSMQELKEILSDYGFFRCHQSYLVPLSEILSIEQERFGRAYCISLRDVPRKLPLSRRQYYELKKILQEQGTTLH